MIGPIIRVALRALRVNTLRAVLTMLGVIIGVGAVVAMMALGSGARVAIARQVQSLGSNLLVVFPGSVATGGVQQGLGAQQNLTWEDGQAIAASVPEVEAVEAEYGRTAQVVYAGANTATTVIGVTPDYQVVRNHYVVQGTFFTDFDDHARARVAVLGPNVVENLFGSAEANPIGATIKINRASFTVLGVLETKGAAGFGGFSRDDVVLVPLNTARERHQDHDAAAGRDCGNLATGGGDRHHEHHAGVRHRAHTRNRLAQGGGGNARGCPATVSGGGHAALSDRRTRGYRPRGGRGVAADPVYGVGHAVIGAGRRAGVQFRGGRRSLLWVLPGAAGRGA